MKITSTLLAWLFLTVTCAVADHHATGVSAVSHTPKQLSEEKEAGWHELFNGKDFTGWKKSEHTETFRIEDGKIVANGERSHLFYVGKVAGANFKDFMWECEVMLKPGSNSGMFFHTRFQESGWPSHGHEAQLNNTQHDRIKTGSLYKIKNILDNSPAEDDKWFTQRVVVRGKRVQVFVNGKLVNDYTEPEGFVPPDSRKHRRLSSGTIALQGHDPGSTAYFRRVRVKPLSPAATPTE